MQKVLFRMCVARVRLSQRKLDSNMGVADGFCTARITQVLLFAALCHLEHGQRPATNNSTHVQTGRAMAYIRSVAYAHTHTPQHQYTQGLIHANASATSRLLPSQLSHSSHVCAAAGA